MFSKDPQRIMKMYVKMRDQDAGYLKRVSPFLKHSYLLSVTCFQFLQDFAQNA